MCRNFLAREGMGGGSEAPHGEVRKMAAPKASGRCLLEMIARLLGWHMISVNAACIYFRASLLEDVALDYYAINFVCCNSEYLA